MSERITVADIVELPAAVWLGAIAAYSTYDPTFVPQNVVENFFGAGISVGADMYTFHQTRFTVDGELVDCVSVQKTKNYFTDNAERAKRVNLPMRSLAILSAKNVEVVLEDA